jgi:two-component system, chemotaxis family, sensor kinase CheA
MTPDPYRYFRIEARELVEGLAEGALALERGSADAGVVPKLFRLAHTLKGAARVVRQLELAELSHAAEDVLSRARDGGREVTPEEARGVLALVQKMEGLLAGLGEAPAPQPAPNAPAPSASVARAGVEDPLQTLRIEVEEMNAVLRAVGETGVQVAALKATVAKLRQLTELSFSLTGRLALRAGSADGRDTQEQGLAEDLQAGLGRVTQALEAGLERVDQELADVRDGTDRLRLVPAESLFLALARATRDAARALGKEVVLEPTGGAFRLDGHVLGPLRAALMHLVRNAVAHGIESPAERTRAGKPRAGRIELSVVRRNRRVLFTCRDDGKGIDGEAVRRELVTRGLASQDAAVALSEAELVERLFSGGLSTTERVSQIAGRGVGLDVVREVVERLDGDVHVESQQGRGTTIELSVPVSLTALRALVVEVGGSKAAIPLDAVRETLRLEPANVNRSPEGDSIAHGGKVIPFIPLARALGRAKTERASYAAVVIAAGERSAAIGVDHLRGTFDLVVQPLPAAVQADAVIAGASLDAEGNPDLVLDAAGLLAAATEHRGTPLVTALPLAPILVIDDSLTTRMLEQSILESAGYAVELAVSAEQALEKARQKRYGLFIVDVEMPGMDGFEFVQRTRADPELGRVPAILVTSRGAPEDRKRGERAGASAYIDKGEFDQNLLLANIRRLLG